MTQWGKIKNDTTWANFAYVSGDVEVEDGVTLTIEPGTSIYFAAEDNDNLFDSTVVEFRINGELNAAGSYANPIEFKSLAAIPQPGDWSGIQFFGNNSSGSSVRELHHRSVPCAAFFQSAAWRIHFSCQLPLH